VARLGRSRAGKWAVTARAEEEAQSEQFQLRSDNAPLVGEGVFWGGGRRGVSRENLRRLARFQSLAGLSATRTRTLSRHGGAARLSMGCSAPVTRAIRRFTDLVASRSRPRRSSAWAGMGISNGMSNAALLVAGSGAANGGSIYRRKRAPRRPQEDENDAEDGAPGSEVHEAVREI